MSAVAVSAAVGVVVFSLEVMGRKSKLADESIGLEVETGTR